MAARWAHNPKVAGSSPAPATKKSASSSRWGFFLGSVLDCLWYYLSMDKAKLEKFLLNARTKTYAAGTSKTQPLLPGSVQYEFEDGDLSYRDNYYIGNGIFPGLETVFYKNKPVWSMSYFGDFSLMTEEQADKMLRKALIELWQSVRIYNHVEKDYGDFKYICDGSGSIDSVSGTEEIYVGEDRVYFFYYAGGFIG